MAEKMADSTTADGSEPTGAAFYPLHRPGEQIDPSPSFPAIEEDVLAYWKADGTFQASIDNRGEPCDEFVFYDGPPFANGLPHYGHLLTGYVKDAVGRYQTQRGKRVERRFGWDTHGLPAELEAQRLLGIDDVTEITRPGGIGIEKFNEECRSSVLRYTKEWEDYVTRQARWVDFDNDYKTLDPDYMESVLWAFKQLWDKGLAYQGYRVLPYCWHDRTPLSNHELKMDDDVYQDRQDNTVTVGLRLEEPLRRGAERPELVLIWTTTPWTLPSNVAIAVGPDVEYAIVHVDEDLDSPVAGQDVVIAKDLLGSYARELGEDPQVLATCAGADLVGRRYHPIFDYFDDAAHRAEGAAPGPKAWTIIAADFVTTSDGTGLVHMASAFGEDDMIACSEAGIETVVPVDDGGCLTEEIRDYAGLQVFEANKPIVADLRDGTGPLARRDESRAPSWCARPPTCTPTRTAGAAASRSSTRPSPPGSCASRRSATAWSSSTRTSTGTPATSRTASSASGWRTRVTGRSPATVSGARHPGVGQRQPRLPAHRRLRLLRRAGARLRCQGHRPAPPLHRHPRAAQPRRPHGQVHDAPHPRRPGLLVRVRLHALRPGALPLRERRVVRVALSGRLHRGVHRPDPRLVLHPPRPGHRPVRPARLHLLRLPRHPPG